MRHVHIPKRRTLLDGIVYLVGVLGPLATIPQVYKVYALRDATDIALATWVLWALFDIPWIIYGLARREPPIVITYALWLTVNVLVAIGAVLYG